MDASPDPSSVAGAAGTRTSGRTRKPRGEFWMNAGSSNSQSKLLLDFPELSERKQSTGTGAPKSHGKVSTGRHGAAGAGPVGEPKSRVSAKPGHPRRLSAALAALAQPNDQEPRSPSVGGTHDKCLQRGETPERPRQALKAHEHSSPAQSPVAVARRPATRSTPAKEPAPDSATAPSLELLAAAVPMSAARKPTASNVGGTSAAAAEPAAPAAAATAAERAPAAAAAPVTAAAAEPAAASPKKKPSAKEVQKLGGINCIHFVLDEAQGGKRASRARGATAAVAAAAAAATAGTGTAATGAAARHPPSSAAVATSKAAREPVGRSRAAVPVATAAGAGIGDCAVVVAVMGLGAVEDGGAPLGSPAAAPEVQRTSIRHGEKDADGAAAGGSSRGGSARVRSGSGKSKAAGAAAVGSGQQQGHVGGAAQLLQSPQPAADAPAPVARPQTDQDEEAARPRKRSRKGGHTDVSHAAAPVPQPAQQPHQPAVVAAASTRAGAGPKGTDGPGGSQSRRSGRAAGPSVATASVQPSRATGDSPVSVVAATATTATATTAQADDAAAAQELVGDAGGSKATSKRGGKGSKGTKRRRGQDDPVATGAGAGGVAAATTVQQPQQPQQLQRQGSQLFGKEALQLPPLQALAQRRMKPPAATGPRTESATNGRTKAGSKERKEAVEEEEQEEEEEEEEQEEEEQAADQRNRAEALPLVPPERAREQRPHAQPQSGERDGVGVHGHTDAEEVDGGWSGAMQAALAAKSAAASAAKTAVAAMCGSRLVSPTASVAQSSAGEEARQRPAFRASQHAAASAAAAAGGMLPPPRRAPPPVPRFDDPPPREGWQPPAASGAAGGLDRPSMLDPARATAAAGTAAHGAGGWESGIGLSGRLQRQERHPQRQQQQPYQAAPEDQGAPDAADAADGFFVRRSHGASAAAGLHVEAEASVAPTPTRRHGLSPRRQPPVHQRPPPPLGVPSTMLGRSRQQDPYELAPDSHEAAAEEEQWQQQRQRLDEGDGDYYVDRGAAGDGAGPQHPGRRPPQLHGSDLLASPHRHSLGAPGQGQRAGHPQLPQQGLQQRQREQQHHSGALRSSHAHAGGSWQPAAHTAAGGGDAYWDAAGGLDRAGDGAFGGRQLTAEQRYGATYGSAGEPMEEDYADDGHAGGYPPSVLQQLRQQQEERGAPGPGGWAAAPEADWFVRRAPTGHVAPGQAHRRAAVYTEQQQQQPLRQQPHQPHSQEAAGHPAAGADPGRAPRMKPVAAAQPPAPPPPQQQQPQGQHKPSLAAPAQQPQLHGQSRQPLVPLQQQRQHQQSLPPSQAHSQPLPQHPPAFAIPTLRGRAQQQPQPHSLQQQSQPQPLLQQQARPAASAGAAASTVTSVFSDSLRRALSRADQLSHRNKTRQQEIAENEEDGWTLEQVQSLQAAYYRVDPLHPHFWREVARGVPGKTAAECFSRVFASGRDREERAALAKALRRRPAAAPSGPRGSTKPLTLAAARKWTQKAHEQEQLERLARLGRADPDEDDDEEDDEEDEEQDEEGDEAHSPAARARGGAGGRGGRGGSRGRGGRRPALAIPDDPTEMRRIIDNLQQKHQADRFITSFLRKQGGWAKWHKAVREAQDRRLRGVSAAAAAIGSGGTGAGASSAMSGGGAAAAAHRGPGAGGGAAAAAAAAAGGQNDSDPLARVIRRMLARDEAEELREVWRDADEAEGLQTYGGGGAGGGGGGGGAAGGLYDDEDGDEYDEAREREEEEMRRFLVAEGLLGPDGMPVFG